MARKHFKPAGLAKQHPVQRHDENIVAVAYQKRNITAHAQPIISLCIPGLEPHLAPVVAQLIGSKLIMAGYDEQGCFSIYAKPLQGFSVGENKQIYYDLLQQLNPLVGIIWAFLGNEEGGRL